YEAALDLSSEVRGGLFARQIHHWAALMFVASIMVHLFRVCFTGASRKPRAANWVLGCLLLVLSIAEGFFGYGRPDYLLSRTWLWSGTRSTPSSRGRHGPRTTSSACASCRCSR